MPVLAAIYLLVLFLMMLDSFVTRFRRRGRLWILVLGVDLAAASVIITAFLAYWIAGLAKNVGSVLPYAFALAWVWEFCWAPHDINRGVSELESERLQTAYMRIGFWLHTALVVPAFWFGGRATLRAL
jgi:hypothetical protein